MKCRNPECNAEVKPGVLFCGKCGTPVLANCTKCGAEIPAKKNAKCCPKCGTMISGMKTASEIPRPDESVSSFDAEKVSSATDSDRPKYCTNCNTAIPDKKNVKCCPKCGMMIADMKKAAPDSDKSKSSGEESEKAAPADSLTERPAFCSECGAAIPDKKNVKCCPKCGTMLSAMKKPSAFTSPYKESVVPEPEAAEPDKPVYCPECGAVLHPGDMFCGNCSAPVSGAKSGEKPIFDPKPETEEIHQDSVKKAIIILLVIGFCMFWTGIGGKIIIGRIRSVAYEVTKTTGIEMLDRIAGGVVDNLIITVVQNDAKGFTNCINKIASIASSLSGGSSSIDNLAIGAISGYVSQYLPELRSQLKAQTGPIAWGILFVASYCNVFLIIGAIIIIGGVIAWLSCKCRFKDIKEQHMIPAFIVGGVWIVLVTVITIIVLCIRL